MTDKRDLVAQVKTALEAKGVSLIGPCGAFEITSRVAWALRDEGIGLVAKNPGQEGCTVGDQRYAIDAVMMRDGQTFDLLVNAGGEIKNGVLVGPGNGPAWQVTGAQPPVAWRAPFNPDAGSVVVDPPPLPPPPTDEIPITAVSLLDALNTAIVEVTLLRRDFAALSAKVAQDNEVMMSALSTLRSDLSDLKVAQTKGLSGSLFGYRVTLKP